MPRESAEMLSPHPIRMCWICGRAVSLETCKIDEHGNAVHEHCYAVKLALSKESVTLSKSSQKPTI
jgi:hypothetical protein